jgi:hypothetical protein
MSVAIRNVQLWRCDKLVKTSNLFGLNMSLEQKRTLIEECCGIPAALDPADRRRVAYQLTEKGRALLPVLVALRQWGERWVSGTPSNPVLVDRGTLRPVAPICVQTVDGRPLHLGELDWVDASEVRT